MEFTARELKQIEYLRKRERQWPRMKWFLLAGGIFLATSESYMVYLLNTILRDKVIGQNGELSQTFLVVFAVLWPKCIFGFCVAGIGIGWAIKDWHGNVNRMLLLKLLEAEQKHADSGNSTTTRVG